MVFHSITKITQNEQINFGLNYIDFLFSTRLKLIKLKKHWRKCH